MSRDLSNKLLAELFSESSDDPFLGLFTISHPDFAETIYLINNNENITSRGVVYEAFPVKLVLPVDDPEKNREVSVEFSNVSLDLIDDFRSVTSEIDVKLEMILASSPDDVEFSYDEMKLRDMQYDFQTITAKLVLDDFLNTEMTSEKYTPQVYPGLFG